MMEYPCPLHIRKLSLLTEALIHRSAWNKNSANFAFWKFSEVGFPLYGVLRSSHSKNSANFVITAFSEVRELGVLGSSDQIEEEHDHGEGGRSGNRPQQPPGGVLLSGGRLRTARPPSPPKRSGRRPNPLGALRGYGSRPQRPPR